MVLGEGFEPPMFGYRLTRAVLSATQPSQRLLVVLVAVKRCGTDIELLLDLVPGFAGGE